MFQKFHKNPKKNNGGYGGHGPVMWPCHGPSSFMVARAGPGESVTRDFPAASVSAPVSLARQDRDSR